MANTRELLTRRKGVQNTKKITRTMELISTAKLKKLSGVMLKSRPYSRELMGLVGELLGSGISLDLAKEHSSIKKVLLLSIASNRGLCGAYNVKVVDETLAFYKEATGSGKEVLPFVIGKRAIGMFSYTDLKIVREFKAMDDRTPYSDIKNLANEFMNLFVTGKVDQVSVVYTNFQSTSRQNLVVEQLLPLVPLKNKESTSSLADFIFEPSPEAVLSELAPLAVEMNLYRMFMESLTSEQAYRMRAMKNASDNAEGMIKDLTQLYNRARQSQITLELLDILGGADAV